MSDCCEPSNTIQPKKYKCPVNGKEYFSVSSTTIMHHIHEPWNWHIKQQGYYFCEDPECDVVYYGQDDSVIRKSALRTAVGIKEKTDEALLCYCFGVTHKEGSDHYVKEFVIRSTKEKTCACSIRNPSGRCCLKNF